MVSIWNDEVTNILEKKGLNFEAKLWKAMNFFRAVLIICFVLIIFIFFAGGFPKDGQISILMFVLGIPALISMISYWVSCIIFAFKSKDYIHAALILIIFLPIWIFLTGMMYRYWKGGEIRKEAKKT